MEGPLVSDTTEVLSGAAPASGESPIGHPAADPAGAAPRSSGRSGGDLSKLLVSDLQRIAQELGISGTGRMRKGDLVAAIQERTGGSRPAARGAGTRGRTESLDQSATRGTSAGAGAPRPLNQDAMEADTSVRPGIGEAALVTGGGIGDAPASAGRPAWVRPTARPPRPRPRRRRAPSRPPRTSVASATATGAARSRAAASAGTTAMAGTTARTASPPRRAAAATARAARAQARAARAATTARTTARTRARTTAPGQPPGHAPGQPPGHAPGQPGRRR